MAEITTVDVTTAEGSDIAPLETNDVYNLVEKIASQNIRGAKNGSSIEDGFYEYEVDKGSIVEEAIIKKAEKQVYDKNSYSRAPIDPAVLPKYFNNWEQAQYITTSRKDDIRKVVTNQTSVEEVVAEVIDSLTQGEETDDFKAKRNLLFGSSVKDYAEILGGQPASMKGVIYAIREMYNHLKGNNSDCSVETYETSTPVDDIRVAIAPEVLNLIDIVELANVFNLSKEEMFGKMVIVDMSDLDETSELNRYKVVVYDRKAMGRATRLYDYEFERVARGRFDNHYLTTDRMYFHNGLFKACSIDCSTACASAKAELITEVQEFANVTNVLTAVTSSNPATKVVVGGSYNAVLTAETGKTIVAESVKVYDNSEDITATAYSAGAVSIAEVQGAIVIIATAE